MTENRTLEVFYHGRIVGTLAEMPDKRIAFQYSDSWLGDGFSISPFSLPLKRDVFIPPEKTRDCFGGLFGVFADSLPDSWGELLLDRYLASIGIHRGDISTLDRLAYVGHSGMGALEYHPAKKREFTVDTTGLDYDRIAGECEKVLSSKTSDQLDILYEMGGSSGGTRPKILLSENGREWIVKFPARKDPAISGKREYDYSLCAKKCGILMTDTQLVPSAVCEGYFKTERFDRREGKRVFSVTFAGLLEADFRAPSCDYSTYMKMIRALTRDNVHDTEQMFRTMCFNIFTHNRDDHTKNFSFIYSDDTGWRLAPAYDLTYSDTYWGEHTTSVCGKGKDITGDDLLKTGTDAGLSLKLCNECLEEIQKQTEELASDIRETKSRRGKRIPFSEKLAELKD